MIQLFKGDCLDLLKNIPDGSIDLILTDPPYGTTACKWDVIIPFDPMWDELNRVIKPNGAIVLFGSEPFSSLLRCSNLKDYKYDWIWEKDKGANFPLAKKQPLKKHEIISVFYSNQPFYDYKGDKLEKPVTRVRSLANGGAVDFKGGDYNFKNGERSRITFTHKTKKSILYYPRDSQYPNKSYHPTQKPVALLEYLIKTYTNISDKVLDFTMGSGSTGVAAVNLGRDFIGIERDDKYFAIAEKRISEAEQNSLF
jgi:site-specific DNA-methyltransferase (adenine-specific)